MAETILPTLSDILAAISPNLTTPSLLLCIVASCPPSLVRMYLCFKLLCDCQRKKIIEYLQEYGVTSSYYKVRRFKISSTFGGYNVKQMRKANRTTKSKTKVIYKPLINKTPSDPSTILTAICNIEAISHGAAQQLALPIYDKQLFRDTIIVMWDDLARWKYFCPRIGGMYWLMNFVGSVGKQMKNSELDRLIKTTFSCVDKLLIGKKLPINIRAELFDLLP